MRQLEHVIFLQPSCLQVGTLRFGQFLMSAAVIASSTPWTDASERSLATSSQVLGMWFSWFGQKWCRVSPVPTASVAKNRLRSETHQLALAARDLAAFGALAAEELLHLALDEAGVWTEAAIHRESGLALRTSNLVKSAEETHGHFSNPSTPSNAISRSFCWAKSARASTVTAGRKLEYVIGRNTAVQSAAMQGRVCTVQAFEEGSKTERSLAGEGN